ncbi:hypothetical protein MGYG_02359 [Nannizzia gypsea CBS 118893]|uniref:Uncharacterized protein n=1 Tax=Arthroderma gypseum (strain ATCC MYA-4604 / CBS 118893) TaxID=535722 RepID=E4UR71_ARTGP|nr:hypothetical protein MGYG_02359 [Nannizzia gypsea CBS 118893]EFQ99346.1 hypothetical protein MGYG_02359 [Nannizzia gypsea CBS 118893]
MEQGAGCRCPDDAVAAVARVVVAGAGAEDDAWQLHDVHSLSRRTGRRERYKQSEIYQLDQLNSPLSETAEAFLLLKMPAPIDLAVSFLAAQVSVHYQDGQMEA